MSTGLDKASQMLLPFMITVWKMKIYFLAFPYMVGDSPEESPEESPRSSVERRENFQWEGLSMSTAYLLLW